MALVHPLEGPADGPSAPEGSGERWHEGEGLPDVTGEETDPVEPLVGAATRTAKSCFPEDRWGCVRDGSVLATWNRSATRIVVVGATGRRTLAVVRAP